jgi:hypothetical protein
MTLWLTTVSDAMSPTQALGKVTPLCCRKSTLDMLNCLA